MARFNWTSDPDDPDGVKCVVKHGDDEVVLRANPYGWSSTVCGVQAREVILTDAARRRDLVREGRARRPRDIAQQAAQRWAEDLILAAGADRP